PIATGPLSRWLGIEEGWLGTIVVLVFVLLGDFRVLLLLFRLASPAAPLAPAARDAALWTAFVPLLTLGTKEVVGEIAGELPSQAPWLVYEVGFPAPALWIRQRGLPAWVAPAAGERLAALRSIAAYVALYYALWALADALILALDLDLA